MNHAPVQLGPRELREVYAEPFAAAIRDAGLASVMNSYSSVDGLPCAGTDGDPHRPAARRARLRRRGRGRLLRGRPAPHPPPDRGDEGGRRGPGATRRARRRAAGDSTASPSCRPRSRPGGSRSRWSTRRCAGSSGSKLRLGLFERPYVDAERAGSGVRHPGTAGPRAAGGERGRRRAHQRRRAPARLGRRLDRGDRSRRRRPAPAAGRLPLPGPHRDQPCRRAPPATAPDEPAAERGRRVPPRGRRRVRARAALHARTSRRWPRSGLPTARTRSSTRRAAR